MKVVRLSLFALGFAAISTLLLTGENWTSSLHAQPGSPDKKKLGEEAVRIFRAYCFECHGKDPRDLNADLNILDPTHLKHRDRVVAGSPDKSKLIQRVESKRRPMPPEGAETPMPEKEAKVLRDWVAAGGELPDASTTSAPTPKPAVVEAQLP